MSGFEWVLVAIWAVVIGRAVWVVMTVNRRDAQLKRASAPLPIGRYNGGATTGFHEARNPERSSPGFAAAPLSTVPESPVWPRG